MSNIHKSLCHEPRVVRHVIHTTMNPNETPGKKELETHAE
jgi:hypothetical protein